jgi:hypothetical protein
MDTNAAIRCVVCRELGHAVCEQKKEKVLAKEEASGTVAVYCPNCGQEGHHIDYAATCVEEGCTVPRYEAHTRFSLLTDLLKDIDVCAVDRSRSMRHLNNIYKGLISNIWGQGEYTRVQALFPSLLTEVENNRGGNRSRHNTPERTSKQHSSNRRQTFGGQGHHAETGGGAFLPGMDEVLPSSGFVRKRTRDGDQDSRGGDKRRRSSTPYGEGDRGRDSYGSDSRDHEGDGDSRYAYQHSHFGGDSSPARAASTMRGGDRKSYPAGSSGGGNTRDLIKMYKNSTRSKPKSLRTSEVNMDDY